jgi:hypothetical protein
MLMDGLYIHIAQNYPEPVYSEIFYIQADAAGIAQKNFAQENCRAVLLLYVYWNYSKAGSSITFSDQFNNLLFAQQTGTSFGGWAPIYKITTGQTLRVQVTPIIPFSLSYQYIL